MLGSPQQPVTVDDATLTVNGNANFDGGLTVGTLGSGQGHPEVTVTGALNSVGLVNCINGTVTAGGISQCNHSGDVGVSDPLARFVKPPQVDPTPLPCPAFGNGTKVADLNPGTYNCPLQVNDGTLLLEAGVYELHGGISVTNGGSIKMASATGGGAMLYLPPFISNPFKINGGSINIRPLSPAQSAEFFLGTTALAGVWLWQDADDTTQVTINNPGSITLTGTAYVPGATVVVSNQSNGDGGGGGDERNPDLNLGRLIASGLTLQPGSPDVTITGQ